MADEYEVRLTADNEITDEAEAAAKALDKIPDKVETKVELSGLDKAIAELDKASQEAASTAIAAEELGRALGPELAARADSRALVDYFASIGVEADQVTQKADELAAKLREVDSPDMGGKLGQALGTARGETEKLADSARGANSALANMVGNSVQDLGALGGVAGSLGVAFGQMGEYAADAKLGGEGLVSSLKSMAGVVGPIAALGLAVQLLGTAMAKGQRSAELQAEGIERITEAAEEGEGVLDALRRQIEDTGKLEFRLGGGFDFEGLKVQDLQENLAALNLTLADLADFTGEQPVQSLEDLYQAQHKILGQESDWQALFIARDALNKQIAESEAQRAIAAAIGAQSEEDAADQTAEALDKVRQAHEDSAAAAEEQRDRLVEAARALQEYGQNVARAGVELDNLAGGFERMAVDGEAITRIFDLGNAPLDLAGQTRDIALAIGELSEAAKGVDLSQALDPSNLGADGLLDALDGLRPQIQTKISEAFAAGGPEAARQTADWYVQSIVNELGGKLSADEVARLLNLSDIDATIAVAVEQSSIDRARRQLEILTGVTGESPYTASIALALDAGTITGDQAQALIQERLAGAGVEVPAELAVTADLAAAEDAVEGFTEADRPPAVVDVEANPRPAEQVADDFTDEKRTTTPVDIDASSVLAAGIMLAFMTARRTATIDVVANTLPAALSMLGLLNQQRTAVVDVVLGDVPSQADIRRRIGNVTVPIDIVVGQTVRITGVRD